MHSVCSKGQATDKQQTTMSITRRVSNERHTTNRDETYTRQARVWKTEEERVGHGSGIEEATVAEGRGNAKPQRKFVLNVSLVFLHDVS